MNENIQSSYKLSKLHSAQPIMTSIQLNPEPGFVIKTLVDANSPENPGTKVFINVCTDTNVPLPHAQSNPEALTWSELIQAGQDVVVPIVVSEVKGDIDAKEQFSLVCDCCVHPKVLRESIKSRDVKVLLISTCINLVEQRMNVALSRDFKLPKRAAKGQLSKTVVQQDESTLSLSDSMDSFAKSLLDSDPNISSVLDAPSSELATSTTAPPVKRPLIQEISSTDTAPSDIDEKRYKTVRLGKNKLRVDIDEPQPQDSKITVSKNALIVDSSQFDLSNELGGGTLVWADAVVAKDTGRLSVLVAYV